MALAPDRIAIDSKEYLLRQEKGALGWEMVQTGQPVRWSRDNGFLGGINAAPDSRGDDYLLARNMDTLTYPYLALSASNLASVTITGALGDLPIYVMRMVSAGVTYHYIFVGDRVFKVQVSSGANQYTLRNNRQFTNGTAGRPVYFEGKLWSCWGDGASAPTIKSLDTITADTTNDTWTDVATITARHLSKLNALGTMKMARAGTSTSAINTVQLSPDGTTWTAASFEVGDSSLGINDLHESEKGLVCFKPDNVYEFDAQGNSRPLQTFINAHLDSGRIAANSWMLGTAALWVLRHGLFMVESGGGFDEIGPDAWYFEELPRD